MNPARALGPAIVAPTSAVWHTMWVYIVGPLLGSVLAAAIYTLLKQYVSPSPVSFLPSHARSGGYELLNPGQDAMFSAGVGPLPLARFGLGAAMVDAKGTVNGTTVTYARPPLMSMDTAVASQLDDIPRLPRKAEDSPV